VGLGNDCGNRVVGDCTSYENEGLLV